jgi:hypothetical protein
MSTKKAKQKKAKSVLQRENFLDFIEWESPKTEENKTETAQSIEGAPSS